MTKTKQVRKPNKSQTKKLGRKLWAKLARVIPGYSGVSGKPQV
jgi:hypothetical protein